MFSNYSEIRARFEVLLAKTYSIDGLSSQFESTSMAEAAAYSVLNGGKRLRPALVYKIAELYGFEFSRVDDLAIALESLHCSSLVHDDLPGLDNDSERRGKPTTHVKFGESTAIMAGNSLAALAFSFISSSSDLEGEKKIPLLQGLLKTYMDICAGQVLDVETREATSITTAELALKDRLKTGSLFESCFSLPGFVLGLEPSELESLRESGNLFGQFFQMRDDFLDNEESEENEVAERAAGSDLILNTKTSLSHLGPDRLKEKLEEQAQMAISRCPDRLEGFLTEVYGSLLGRIS